ncbi:MAG: CASTOR/POLLUX-related putative ion channel, partial [Actinomycetes bacterium]
ARIRYWFDTGLSRGPLVVIGWLGLLTLSVIVFAALVVRVLGLVGVNGEDERLNFGESLWQALLRVVDPGTFAGDTHWFTRFIALTITVAGIFLAGSLIGLIANLVDQKVENLRKGRSNVLETGHTLILGWSPRVPVIVSELVNANGSERRSVVVVFADTDKTQMEDQLREHVGDFQSTKLVCRSGNPNFPADLEIVNVAGARSVVVVGETDASVVKTLLAVRSLNPEFSNSHVVAEVQSSETESSVDALFGPRVVTVNSDLVVAELTAQACRQRGLAAAFRELLSFDGCEVYFGRFPELAGRTYVEAQLAFEHSAVIGRLGADGVVDLNPHPTTVIAADDQLVAIAEDDRSFVLTGLRDHTPSQAPSVVDAQLPAEPARLLVVGWSDLGPHVIAQLDEFVRPGTVIEVLVDPDHVDPESVKDSISTHHATIQVTAEHRGPEALAQLAVAQRFEEVIVLGYRHHLSTEDADARTLLTRMAFSQALERHELRHVRIVAELLDQRHTPLALATGVDDFVVSDELTSLLIAQLSERHELHQVFADLFQPAGCILEMRPLAMYGVHATTTFEDLVRVASHHEQSAIGYRRASAGSVVLNPDKSADPALGPEDLLLVVRKSGV